MTHARPIDFRSYPDSFERFWINELTGQTWRDEADALERLAPVVGTLSDLFTTDRPDAFADYGQRPEQIAAYGLFYFPQTYVRSRFPVAEAVRRTAVKPQEAVRVLDIGAGTGAASLAAAEVLVAQGLAKRVAITAVDHSSASLTTMARCARFSPVAEVLEPVETITGDARALGSEKAGLRGTYDWILAGFSLNELFAEATATEVYVWLTGLKSLLRPGGMLVILEPAIRAVSEKLERMRNLAASHEDFTVIAPCLHQCPCPLLDEGKYTCHEVRSWLIPRTLEFLNRTLWRSLGEVKYSFLCLQQGAPASSPNARHQHSAGSFRLISPFSAMKGQFMMTGCAADGCKYTYDLQTRGMKRRQIKDLAAEIERGDILHAHGLQPLKDPERKRIPDWPSVTSIERIA